MNPSGVLSRLRDGSPVASFSLFALLFFSVFAVWSLATPLMGVPDEPVHAIRAVALVRGDFVGTAVHGPRDPNTVVTVPELYSRLGTVPGCFAFNSSSPASCAPAIRGTSTPTQVEIYVGRYPPLYYAVVGLPSLVTVSSVGVRLMRLFSAALSALLLALGATSIVAWSRSRLLLAGFVLAATPQLFFLGGAISPSGFEISAAISLWCCLIVLALERFEDPPLGLVVATGISACTLVLARPLSPFWAFLIGVTVLVLAGRRRVAAALRHRRVQLALGAAALCGVLALAWIFTQHALDHLPVSGNIPKNLSDVSIFFGALGQTGLLLRSAIGEFGWLSTQSPLGTYLTWYAGLALVGGLAAVTARRRELWVLAGVAVAAVLVPVVILAVPARQYGFAGQGRDFLPLTVGLPLVAAAIAGGSELLVRHRARAVTGVTVLVAAAQVLAFGQALRRNAVGLGGPINYLNGAWRPPLGALVLTILAVLAWAAIATVTSWLAQEAADPVGASGTALPE